MKNPVQIVLNTQHYVESITPTGGGGGTDFFAGLDEQFKKHKSRLDQSLNILELEAIKNKDDFIYAKVELQNKAWAKSHRPTEKLFSENNVKSLTSGNELGSLIVALDSNNITQLKELILGAPEVTEWVLDKKNKLVAKATALRSEVGAVRDIHVYSVMDKRGFSLHDAITWLKDPITGSAYYVETFVETKKNNSFLNKKLEQLMLELRSMDLDVEVSIVEKDWLLNTFIIVKFNNKNDIKNYELHEKLLTKLDDSIVVRTIQLPPILQTSKKNISTKKKAEINKSENNKDYPVVGIIDTGVAKLDGLGTWIIGKSDFLDTALQDESHGTFIGGLITNGTNLNKTQEINDLPCKIFDLNLFPTINFEDYYPRGFIDFIDQIQDSIIEAIELGVRIFNMSISVLTCVENNQYSLFANMLDYISDKYDVIFVLPAGNLSTEIRNPWASTEKDCLKQLATYRYQGQDRIYQPADSIRSITVGALDPCDENNSIKPSRYSRRGPGPCLGHKPDIAHIGGRYDQPHGLASVCPDGYLVEGCGTSYSAPLVAKTLANIDHAIKGKVKKETLKALLIHHSQVPTWVTKNIKSVSRDFVGAGMPKNSFETLVNDDYEITLVFEGKIGFRQSMIFDFTWPQSLVNEKGGCIGEIEMTTIYSPNIDRNNGAEFILNNVDTWLRQVEKHNIETGKISYKSFLKAESHDGILEKERVEHGLKWWPVKKIIDISKGRGKYSQCRLVVEELSRYGYQLMEPIPFTVILTIRDPSRIHNIYNELRSQLQSHGVQLGDIRTALSQHLRF